MGKYEVLTAFNDLEKGGRIEVGTIVELTDERYATMVENAKFYGGIDAFLKPLDDETATNEEKGKEGKKEKTKK